MMVEGDVSLDGQGTPRQTNTAVMAHRGVHRHRNATITLSQWIDLVLTTNKAIKVGNACCTQREKGCGSSLASTPC